MTHIFDADLVFAGLATYDKKKRKVEKKDKHGRVLDIHSLRHSFCTMVAQSGVNMQIAQRLMRHATPAMTARYTHLNLTDLGGAIASLPDLPVTKCDAAVVGAQPDLRPTLRPTFARTSVQKDAFSCTVSSGGNTVLKTVKTHENPNKHRVLRMVGEAGIEPASPFGERILSPSCMPIPPLARKENWRRHPDSNRGIKALQASALPLGYAASEMGALYVLAPLKVKLTCFVSLKRRSIRRFGKNSK